ncbi:MAG: ComEA family DNA-binding protein [Gammaproteobacteria bacterium]|nr:ComEA family DNA-binding protein [Gammaproteobacteria bacterium]
MGLHDRDYLRDRHRRVAGYLPPVPRRPWWRKLGWQTVLGAVVALAGAVTVTAWLLRDVSFISDSVGGLFRPAKASLVVNINTATRAELETLPGIGPALAALIEAGRPYRTVNDLERVKGIGPRTVESLSPYVRVEGDTGKIR